MDNPGITPAAPQPKRATGKKTTSSGGKTKKHTRRGTWKILLLLALTGLMIVAAGAAGGYAGYRSGEHSSRAVATEVAVQSLDEQYALAMKDLQEARYDLARQRFEYILKVNPNYPNVSEPLAQAMSILYATATPTLVPPTVTTTPTRDLRPVEELLTQARNFVAGSSWDQAIDTALALRKADPAYETAKVDGILFISLRQRGFDKIWQQRNLEGGIYDLALAARFGPLDAQANSARELARLYLFGSSFWEVYPDQAVYFFGQVAAAAPGLTDASGWTAAARYAQSLVDYGDLLMTQGDPCTAQEQYGLAMRSGAQGAQEKYDEAALRCSPPTHVPKPTDASTTEPPVSTTEAPVVTEPPPATTQPPVVTEPPPATTQPPVVTEPPPANTEPPVETVPPPVETDPPPDQTDLPLVVTQVQPEATHPANNP